MAYTAAGQSIVAMLGFVGFGITSFAVAQAIVVFLDIEENTRSTRIAVENSGIPRGRLSSPVPP
jgi:hypothetical protein